MDTHIEMLLDSYPEKVVEIFNNLRQMIFECASIEPEEKLWARLPSYYVGDRFVRLIPFKDHINIESGEIMAHRQELLGYKITPKGMLQIYVKQDIPYEVLQKIFIKALG